MCIRDRHLHVSVEEEFEMSADNNFVILVLDTADSREFTSLLEEHPEYREIFGDFTYFENTTGAYTLSLIHILNGAHVPYIYDKDMNIINELDGTYEQSAQATMVGAMDYVEHLRNSEAYDNTVLIVMSDHGYNGSLGQSGEATWMRQCALLLIKGRNEHHDTMQISQAPISFEDLQEAYVRLLDGRRSDEVFDWKEGDARERRFLRYSFLDDDHMQEYIQTGYASDMDTMRCV